MWKFVQFLFSRVILVSFVLILQVLWAAILFFQIGNFTPILKFIMWTLSVIISIWLLNKWDNPAYKLAWIIPILMFPTLGGMLYLLYGNKEPTRRLRKNLEYGYYLSQPFLEQEEEIVEELRKKDMHIARQCEYIDQYGLTPVYKNTETYYFPDGESYYKALLEELKKAKHYIFLEFFIIEKGKMWDSILDVLLEKVKKGVEVRIIYDDVGCVAKLPYKYYDKLQQLGIQCVSFNHFIPVFSMALNHRDHRKIVVIDGDISFSGGINLADEYINEVQRFGYWKDTGIMLKGDATWNFTVMFLQMWNSIRRSDRQFEKYKPRTYFPEGFAHDGFVQPYGDSPLDQEIVGENVYLNLINSAKNYIYATTPYLIIDNEMMTALCLAAKRGLDVRILTPGIPDKKLTFLLTQSYYHQLVNAGVKIYEYTPGFLHAKMMVADDETATIGTINLDYRSLYLHFECGVFLYQSRVVAEIKKDIQNSIEKSHQITEKECYKNWFQSMLQGILRIFAPLM